MELAVVYMMQGGLFSLLTYRISCFKGWVCAEVVSAAAQQAGCKLLTAVLNGASTLITVIVAVQSQSLSLSLATKGSKS